MGMMRNTIRFPVSFQEAETALLAGAVIKRFSEGLAISPSMLDESWFRFSEEDRAATDWMILRGSVIEEYGRYLVENLRACAKEKKKAKGIS